MKTLPTNVLDNYLLTGNSPRFFVSVADSDKYWATAAQGDYTNRVSRIQSINDSAAPFGGMRDMAGTGVDILKAGENVEFYTTVDIFPRYQGSNVGAGRTVNSGLNYATVRGAVNGGGITFTALTVGQSLSAGVPNYSTYRGFLQFDIPDDVASCEDAYIALNCTSDASTTDDFYIYAVLGSWVTGQISTLVYRLFDGWASGGTSPYTGYILNESFLTSLQLSTAATNYLRFNRAGRQRIVDYAGSTLKLVLLSNRDYLYDAGNIPTGNEFVRFEVSEDNQTPLLTLVYNTVKPDNKRTRIFLGYSDATTGLPSATTSMLNVWSGVVDRWSMAPDSLSLSLRYDDFKYNRRLSANVITRSSTEYQNCSDDVVGKPIPIVVGDFTSNVEHGRHFGSYLDEATLVQVGAGDHVKGYIYDQIGSTQVKIVVSANELRDTGVYVGLYENAVETVVPVPCKVTYTTSGRITAEVRSDGLSSNFFPYNIMPRSSTANSMLLSPLMTHVPSYRATSLYSATVTDPLYAIDYDSTNYTQITGPSQVLYDVDTGWGVAGLYDDDIRVVVETNSTIGYPASDVGIVVWYKKQSGGGWDFSGQTYTANGTHILELSSDADTNYPLHINIVNSSQYFSSSAPFYFRNLGVYVGYNRDIPPEVYLRCDGVPDDASGTYTGTSGALIENPADVIKWFSVAKGGYSTTDVDSSFTTVRNTLSSWKFAFQWSEDNSTDNIFNYGGSHGIVHELAEQCNSLVWQDNTGALKVKTYDPDGAFANSGSAVPGELDIFEYSGSPTSGVLTRNPLLSFDLQQMEIDEAYNSFVLRYAKNYATGNYDKVVFMGNGGGVYTSVSHNITSSYLATHGVYTTVTSELTELKQLTAACYSEVGRDNEFVYEAWAIRDDETATRLLQRMIWWYSRRRFKAILTTGLNAVEFELGDLINIRTPDIIAQFGTAFANVKRWMITRMNTDLVSCKIELEVVESDVY